ncbi:hypothetical protein CORC01_10799 [Colletotrichum orchidophilum]|uniref:Uncharacterized protein n=1 Tax=Colletotrichum orchidophilum TaxID=1209926 RepID=A0A1G4AXL1_9PEZI|nr:uncharacterized protein CORC01_10799 [Colletotrichum orchidophilum]OHE93900.1 hypothetical protein CORC01_10799 [Colletotrichum orchidophilum]
MEIGAAAEKRADADKDVLKINSFDGRGAHRAGDSKISHHENPKVAKDTNGGRQLGRRQADGSALQMGMLDIGTHGVFDTMVGNKSQAMKLV